MSGRRLLAAAGVAVFALLVGAAPASAAEPTVRWTRPTVEDAVIRAPGPIKGTVSTKEADKQTIKELHFDLVSPDGAPQRCRVEMDEAQRVQKFDKKPVAVDFELAIEFLCNGAYQLNARVVYEESLLGVPVSTKESNATLSFDVAIPPAQVSGLKGAYDPATKEVRLTWNPNTEKDLLGYRIQRNPPGPTGFEPLGDRVTEAAFTDIAIDAQHRYRVIAVRAGPHDVPIEGKASAAVAAGPDPPQPTVPTLTSTPSPGTAGAVGNRPKVRRRTATTVDTGFSKDLPFDPSRTTTTQVPTTSTEPEGQAAVLAEFDDDDDPRATLVPIAGGLALLMSAVHMRLLSKRVGEDDIPILPGA